MSDASILSMKIFNESSFKSLLYTEQSISILIYFDGLSNLPLLIFVVESL